MDFRPNIYPEHCTRRTRLPPIGTLRHKKMRNLRNQVVNQLKTIDSKRGMDAVLEAPKRMKREWQKSGATGAITRFPIPTVLVFLLLTVYFVTQSGFLDDTRFDDDPNNPFHHPINYELLPIDYELYDDSLFAFDPSILFVDH